MKNFIILAIGIFLNHTAMALDYGCMLKPIQIDGYGSNLVKRVHAQNRSLPDSITIRSDFSGEINSFEDTSKNKTIGTIEGFYRPQIDDYYSVLPIPMFGVALSRDTQVLYICAHIDEDPNKTHFTVYMLRGYHLDKTKLGTIISNTLHGPGMKVKPATVSVLGLNEIRKELLFWMEWFPVFQWSFQAIVGLQRLLFDVIGDITELGIERITLTKDHVELAGDIDLNKPDKPGFVKIIPFKNK